MTEQQEIGPYTGISLWEQQCIDETEKTPDTDVELQNAKDLAVQKLWFLFQNAATGITQLYKDRQNGVSLWVPFQTAASSVTNLYKGRREALCLVITLPPELKTLSEATLEP
ncbi:UPF0472 protein C16orf72 homolog [Trichonephila clavipes]|uniref:UPF0472 protein C16orf72 homolog n=1 Tax=Trichonephila clavipes TaxID=2585209 RepID=A0A8X6S1R7_TRICX|nr:UPF0472 protein C16orf72 homolog [Trichonephila clavipes]